MSLIGSLIYLAMVTRPDISFAVSKAGRAMANPTQTNMVAAKQILRYLRGTTSRGITYGPNGSSEIEGYTDADFVGDLDSRQSTSRYVFMLGNGAISWITLLKEM